MVSTETSTSTAPVVANTGTGQWSIVRLTNLAAVQEQAEASQSRHSLRMLEAVAEPSGFAAAAWNRHLMRSKLSVSSRLVVVSAKRSCSPPSTD